MDGLSNENVQAKSARNAAKRAGVPEGSGPSKEVSRNSAQKGNRKRHQGRPLPCAQRSTHIKPPAPYIDAKPPRS